MNSIAPAAKARPQGSRADEKDTKATPSKPPTGSTSPVSVAYHRDFPLHIFREAMVKLLPILQACFGREVVDSYCDHEKPYSGKS